MLNILEEALKQLLEKRKGIIERKNLKFVRGLDKDEQKTI